MNKVVVLLSGGLDSAVLAVHAQRRGRDVVGLWIDYGQPACRQEGDAARNIAARYDFQCCAMHVGGINLATMNRERGAGPRVVPMRNLILASLGTNLALAVKAQEVWFGATADDQAEYADCRPQFVDALSAATLGVADIKVRAPFISLTKQEVARYARDYGIDPRLTWSCYVPDAHGDVCGTCNSCLARAAALQ